LFSNPQVGQLPGRKIRNVRCLKKNNKNDFFFKQENEILNIFMKKISGVTLIKTFSKDGWFLNFPASFKNSD
jgi:hypothetical protein